MSGYVLPFCHVGPCGERRNIGLVVGDVALLFFLALLNFPMSQVTTINFKVECLETFRQRPEALLLEENVGSEDLRLSN
jgi:hypothetical protein